MVMSYSAVAQPNADTPKVMSIASKTSPSPSTAVQPSSSATEDAPASSSTPTLPASSSTSTSAPEAGSSAKPQIKHLILDAGPLLSLTPLRHLAEKLYTTPAVLAELRDPKAREYFKRIQGGMEGVNVEVVQPTGEAMARAVIAFAKKTGDYAVLSTTDLGVIALTLQYEMKENGLEGIRLEPGKKGPAGAKAPAQAESDDEEEAEEHDEEEDGAEPNAAGGASNEIETAPSASLDSASSAAVQMNDLTLFSPPSAEPTSSSPSSSISPPSAPASAPAPASAQADDDDSDSDAGEWITPSNVSVHRSRDLGHLPEGGHASLKEITAACMTGDFAVQNVLLAMGLGLVGEGGKRISKVKSWVLRCHACFKTCKDPSKKFCPSCGNPTLLRTSTTTTANGKTHLHLKKNYQYNLRGTKFTIPDAKPGRAKGQLKGGTGLILREDQREWTDAVKMEEGRRGKEEKKMLKGWDDPDWMPEIITVGMSGKGRMGSHGLPNIGHGRKNPNIAKKKR
ncbi:art-4 protein [Dioszegia hungarica]|uniref:20S-pre-rRNA D-site endonuclease NOB1 n=1 Tax=Dioszegia hungarica TaxID=4972 RepID=A0AA38H5B3_9TREE|nr:art-4 protein [Dioszegia hungarica]KAI9634315.1 art-4 protein [Dioszegia hungarica]